jgi:hypothetical protein
MSFLGTVLVQTVTLTQVSKSRESAASLSRFQADGDRLLNEGRRVGVRLEPAEEPEALAYDLARLSVIALAFPKFRDGRAFTSAHVLKTRLGFTGEIRAVGDVVRDQAQGAQGQVPERLPSADRQERPPPGHSVLECLRRGTPSWLSYHIRLLPSR